MPCSRRIFLIASGRDRVIVATETTALISRIGGSTPRLARKGPTGTRGISNTSPLNPLQKVAAPLGLARASRNCFLVTWIVMGEGVVR
jgi:hypothetical protein